MSGRDNSNQETGAYFEIDDCDGGRVIVAIVPVASAKTFILIRPAERIQFEELYALSLLPNEIKVILRKSLFILHS